ncbi:Protein croquemort [Olea europaea subsp. europaea]|uniref:Protein croquemort n=1 Tax=Olea europaea subsp. europaea TaxID=158383 RepID=A0A8S0UF39_OLEEU|nr:Protein croquemort [Olea europaea subsp. europaea]
MTTELHRATRAKCAVIVVHQRSVVTLQSFGANGLWRGFGVLSLFDLRSPISRLRDSANFSFPINCSALFRKITGLLENEEVEWFVK